MSFLIITQPAIKRDKTPPHTTFLRILLFFLTIFCGCKARQVIKPTPQMDVEPQFWVRVLLFENIKTCGLASPSSFSVINTTDKEVITQARFRRTDVPFEITILAGKIAISGKTFPGEEVIIAPDTPHIFSLDGSEYRGKLKLKVDSNGDSFDALNFVPLEPYLAGVVGAEMPDYWEPAALQAQAIAARTYCLYYKKRFGIGRSWDVRKTQANQVYIGVASESAQVWDAVDKTYGEVLVCKHHDGSEDIFPTYYSSVCGGHTEDSKNVFGDSFEPLAGVACPYCSSVARPGFFFWPMVQFDKDYVTDKLLQKYPKLKRLGKIKNITVAAQSDYGEFARLTKIKLVGSTGKSDFLRSEDLRLTIDPTGRKIKSTICQIVDVGDKWAFSQGRGWGHGAGMCQCGAQGMARQGKTAREILQYYYAGSRIKTVY